MEISRDFTLSNYNRTVLRVRVRTCRVPSAKLLAVFVLYTIAPTRSCQGRDEKSTSRFRGGIRLPSLQRRRDRDGQLALELPAGKAAYEAGIQVIASAEAVADLEGVLGVPWNPPFWTTVDVDIAPSYGSRQVLDFMEPSQPSSYQRTLALAHLRVILNEY